MTVTGRPPSFLVIGAAKSGTTSLAHYLRQHPDVFVAREKEAHYFTFQHEAPDFRGPGDASEFMPLVIRDATRYLECFAPAGAALAAGEASVYYSYRPESLERALAMNPAMRFVMVLREPVDRAYSAYSHQWRDDWEPNAKFLDALRDEDRRVEAGWGFGWHYRRVSDYVPQLEAARRVVPEGQLHVMLYEDLVANPTETMQRVYAFLGVDSSFVCDTSLVLNASGSPRFAGLNRLLTRQNRMKTTLKRVVPYRVGVELSQRVRNWNLARNELTSEDRAAIDPMFAFDRARLTELSGCDLSSWEAEAGTE